MAQAEAAPKAARALRMLAARLTPHRAGPLMQLESERAALALRRAGPGGAPREEVVFLVPLVAPADVGDWTAVTGRLTRTLESFRAQTDTRWRAVICCQTAPPLPDDPRIRHLPFDDPTPGNDKWRKLRALVSDLSRTVTRPVYVMSFDADDLLRQGTVAEMLERQAPGYLVRAGLVRDLRTGAVALADRRDAGHPLRKPFWKLCGSCAALAHDPAQPESAAFLREMLSHEHRMFPYLAALAGRGLQPLARPAVLYELNHGENFGARRGRQSFKTRYVERYRVAHGPAREALLQGFP